MSDPSLPGRSGQGGASLLDRIIRFCLENKLIVALAVLFIVAWGLMAAPFDWNLGGLPRRPVPTDAIPDIGENQQIVFTRWMGQSPQDVEDQVTYPLTTSLMGIPGVRTIRSSSAFGFSSIYIIFRDNVDFYWSRSRVLEKLNSLPADTLPPGVQPMLGPDATALGQVFWYTLEGRDPDGNPTGGWDLDELRSIQDWNVRYRLLAAEGISEVASVGGYVREYQVDVDPDAMRTYGVTLEDVFTAVRMANVDVGARTIELNRVEYVVRGLGFIQNLSDLEYAVVKASENVPVYVKDVAHVSLGPALRRGALDKGGAEAVGAVAVVRYGFNPLAAIKNLKAKIAEATPGLPTRTVVDYTHVKRPEVEAFARAQGFEAYAGPGLDQEAWLAWLRGTPRAQWPPWVTTSKVTIVPFYDRTGLIYETLGTLSSALSAEILVTIIVVLVSVLHLRSSVLISTALPLAVLMCFIAMSIFGVDANIVALSGIAIAIGTIVDMSIIVCENTLRHLALAPPDEPRLEVVFRATSEVGSAVLTAVLTTVVGFLPVFFMTGAEGKLFRPLAFTKTFALVSSVIVALTVVPPGAYLLFARRVRSRWVKRLGLSGLVVAGILLVIVFKWWIAGSVLVAFSVYGLVQEHLPALVRKASSWLACAVGVAIVGVLLTMDWEPLGPAQGLTRNLIFTGVIIGSLMGFFYAFRRFYEPMLRWCLAHKILCVLIPVVLVVFGIWYVWLGPVTVFGRAPEHPPVTAGDLPSAGDFNSLRGAGLIGPTKDHPNVLEWKTTGMTIRGLAQAAADAGVPRDDLGKTLEAWLATQPLGELARLKWTYPKQPGEIGVAKMGPRVKARWTLARDWNGRGKEFMPPLDEGSFLWMPTTMPHASIGEALDVLSKQDEAFNAIPEVESAVGKVGRVDSPLDPAPVSMIETVISYKPEYRTDDQGHRINYAYDKKKGKFLRDQNGNLEEDPHGRPFRQWRDEIKSPEDIWREIADAGQIPGTTGAPTLQPIAARLVMLQSGMRAPMGVKVKGPNLPAIEKVGLEIERLLKQVPSVDPEAVFADRIVGKPYLEIEPDRKAIARYGVSIRRVLDVINGAIGGQTVTTTVEGRERYPVQVRYLRELRDQIETLKKILVPSPGGQQIPLGQVATFRYVRGPQMIKSEDTSLIGYVLFDAKPGNAEVDVVQQCSQFLQQKVQTGELVLPAGVSFTFAGTYENQVRARKTLAIVLPLALFIIFLILYLQFRSVSTTLVVFSGIGVAWAGGFMLIWAYAQPWFMDFSVFGVDMRDLFQIHTVNLSVAVWVGFLALFGIASDNGVVIATYLKQSFARRSMRSLQDVRDATVEGAVRRIRPCLMTSATTILALIPVLTSTGRGADVMVPMAIPSFGGMLVVLISAFIVPVLFCGVEEARHAFSGGNRSEVVSEEA